MRDYPLGIIFRRIFYWIDCENKKKICQIFSFPQLHTFFLWQAGSIPQLGKRPRFIGKSRLPGLEGGTSLCLLMMRMMMKMMMTMKMMIVMIVMTMRIMMRTKIICCSVTVFQCIELLLVRKRRVRWWFLICINGSEIAIAWARL